MNHGIKIAFNGTNTHLLNIDCRTITGPDGTSLSGDMAARILDVAGIVVNPNTIPGDKTALKASGIRLGSPWLTQRGMGKSEMVEIGDIITELLLGMKPFSIESRAGKSVHAKINFDLLEKRNNKDLQFSTTPIRHQFGYLISPKSDYKEKFCQICFSMICENTTIVNYV